MNKLSIRLSLAFVLISWLIIIVISVFVERSVENNFRSYVHQRSLNNVSASLVVTLETHYEENRSWDGIATLLTTGSDSTQGRGQGRGQSRGQQGQRVVVADPLGKVVAATDSSRIDEQLDPESLAFATPLHFESQVAGWLVIETPALEVLDDTEASFLADIKEALLIIAVVAGFVAIAIGVLLAWRLGRPIRQLTGTVRRMAVGNHQPQFVAQGTDEVKELALAFNHLSLNLEEQEAIRKRMAANVAHELRTPVTVLQGHLEALLDDVFPMEKAQINIALDQTLHLSRLVADLRLLTLAEAGQISLEKQSVAPGAVVSKVIDSFLPMAVDAGIKLTYSAESSLPEIRIDVDRIRQVLDNLIANALRHTPTGGQIEIRAGQSKYMIRFEVCNTGHKLTAEQLTHLFEPFWRADAARDRDHGGSGLGLAIARQLVQLHGGKLWAEQHDSWTIFTFELPLQPT